MANRIREIIRGIGSGLKKLARTADATVGNFERVFGRIRGPGEGMADDSRIMARTAVTARRGRRSMSKRLRLGRDRNSNNLDDTL